MNLSVTVATDNDTLLDLYPHPVATAIRRQIADCAFFVFVLVMKIKTTWLLLVTDFTSTLSLEFGNLGNTQLSIVFVSDKLFGSIGGMVLLVRKLLAFATLYLTAIRLGSVFAKIIQ